MNIIRRGGRKFACHLSKLSTSFFSILVPGNFNLEGHVAVDFDFPEAIGLRGNEISWEAFARRRFFFPSLIVLIILRINGS